jgi:hypothetical protein
MSEDVGRVSISEKQVMIIMELLEYESIRCEVVRDTERLDAVRDLLVRTREQIQSDNDPDPEEEPNRSTSYLPPNTCNNCD